MNVWPAISSVFRKILYIVLFAIPLNANVFKNRMSALALWWLGTKGGKGFRSVKLVELPQIAIAGNVG